ncbi:energy transducer TonB [Desulfurispira natronophila]|uniref:Protein TonB n=1 Tax=Desulfurispira natronophila TaxID=682562 RepID=A0A7W7Y5Z8_9BACT|nr:TonB family protein [Desulfurispira natronophila]MBB5022688.1 protein TonB [Desulfurispira natronophila]
MRFAALLILSLILHVILGLVIPYHQQDEPDIPATPIEVEYSRETRPTEPEPAEPTPPSPPARIAQPSKAPADPPQKPATTEVTTDETGEIREKDLAQAPLIELPRRSVEMDDLLARESEYPQELKTESFDPYRLSEKNLRQLDQLLSDEDASTPQEDVITFEEGFYRAEYASFLWQLRRKIENVWIYPRAAIQDGDQGIVLLRFTINRSGELTGVELVRNPSQSAYLANAAMRAVRDAAPYNPLPEPLERLTINGVFVYSLGGVYIHSR